jgi:drug/metabolite transporter (DMT)-like permease
VSVLILLAGYTLSTGKLYPPPLTIDQLMNQHKETSLNPNDSSHSSRLRWGIGLFFMLCAGLVLADFIFHRHTIHPWETLWGFYALFGFVACVLLVLIAKVMRLFLMRSEDYYDNR